MRNTIILFFIFIANSYAWETLPSTAPAPVDNPTTAEKVELGKKLFFDNRLSKDNTVSCNTCHNVFGSGTDNLQFSKGIYGQFGGRNAPTVWNAAFWSVQFWDGRALTLEEQAKGPITNPVEMGMANHDEAVAKIKSIPGYAPVFAKAFPENSDINIDNISKAIAAYERTLLTPDSAYDRYLKGDTKALSPSAQHGMRIVQHHGCTACHSGPHFMGPGFSPGTTAFYQIFPKFKDNEYEEKYKFSKDGGLYEFTKKEADRHYFRVQSWRNVSETSPYFHNGSVKTLDEAVRVMSKTQLNFDMPEPMVRDVVEFLKSLKGEFPKQTVPILPE